jgi:hypothetical protein
VNIIETGVANKNWRLCAISEEEDMADELVFRVQGIILKNNLIPRNLERYSRPSTPAHILKDDIQSSVAEKSLRGPVHRDMWP